MSKITNDNIKIKKLYIGKKPSHRKKVKIETRLNNINYIKRLFPLHELPKNKKLNNLKISEVGKFSVSNKYDAKFVSDKIKFFMGDDKKITITDATANNGGNSISFGLNFNKVNSVEIDKKEYDILVNNINVYNLNNIKTYNKNYLKILEDLKQEVVFIDPPWGEDYKKDKLNLKLYLNTDKRRVNLLNVIDKIYKKTLTEIVVCKVPFNYNFIELYKKFYNIKKIKLYKRRKYIIIFLLPKKVGEGENNLYNYVNTTSKKKDINK